MKELYMMYNKRYTTGISFYTNYETALLARYIACVKISKHEKDNVMTEFSAKKVRQKYCKDWFNILNVKQLMFIGRR